jgi:hypothetical protein
LAETNKASPAQLRELVALEQKDQSSDTLLWRLRVQPESLSERDKAALAIDLVNYTKVGRQQGLSEQQVQNKITALLDGRMPTEYVFPYASGDKAYQDYYVQKLKETGEVGAGRIGDGERMHHHGARMTQHSGKFGRNGLAMQESSGAGRFNPLIKK